MKKPDKQRQGVSAQDPGQRIKNFFEVSGGFDGEKALKEASRCLQCKDKPCRLGCPVGIDIPAFIALVKEGKPAAALAKIKEKNFLPAVCGRVCPQEDQCEAMCVLNKMKIPINIGALERFSADHGREGSDPASRCLAPDAPEPGRRKKIAVIGSGPAGLTCSGDLALRGHEVTLFESLHLPGGVLSYGIPEFRLPKKIVEEEVAYITSLGVRLRVNVLAGCSVTFDDLWEQGMEAIFIATGAGLPKFLQIAGENAAGVYSANEFLTRVNLMKAYDFPRHATPVKVGQTVLVIGGGNVALDSARCARRLGARVLLIYRRTKDEMPARREEIENAAEEGIELVFLTSPVRIIEDDQGKVKGLETVRMELREADPSGRPKPVAIAATESVIEADTVIVAIGQNPNPLLPKALPGLKLTDRGTIAVDDRLMTSMDGVFAGGDIVSGADTVISAMGAGKKAAEQIHQYLKRDH